MPLLCDRIDALLAEVRRLNQRLQECSTEQLIREAEDAFRRNLEDLI